MISDKNKDTSDGQGIAKRVFSTPLISEHMGSSVECAMRVFFGGIEKEIDKDERLDAIMREILEDGRCGMGEGRAHRHTTTQKLA